MIAESICEGLKRKLNNNNLNGTIHSVFENALNIITNDNDFIMLLTIDKPMAPQAVRLYDVTSFQDYGIERNMKVLLQNDYIWIEELNFKIVTDKAKLWEPGPLIPYTKENEEKLLIKLSIMEQFLLDSKNYFSSFFNILSQQYKGLDSFNNIITSDESFEFINERFLRFVKAFIEEEESIGDFAKGIIGYGIGLTPSIDDFICGMMISNIYLAHYFNRNIYNSLRFNNLIIKDIDGKTTRVSEEMLKFSARGYVNENIRNLILSLVSNTSIEGFEENLNKVADFGFSSGTDIISGIYICSILLFNH